MYYFAVLTYPGGVPQSLIDNAIAFADTFDSAIVVLEYGKSNVNPHINVVYDCDTPSWSSNAIKYLKQLYPVGTNFVPKRTVINKRCPTYHNVVGGYLQKESKAQILLNKGFDIEDMKKLAQDSKKNIVLTNKNILDVIYTYSIDNHIELLHPTKDVFSSIIEEMFCEGYQLLPHLKKDKIQLLYNAYLIKYCDIALKDAIQW